MSHCQVVVFFISNPNSYMYYVVRIVWRESYSLGTLLYSDGKLIVVSHLSAGSNLSCTWKANALHTWVRG